MKSDLLYAFILLFAWTVTTRVNPAQGHECDCSHHAGGCAISQAAPEGFKCKCKYKGGWTCSGSVFPCVGDEKCPGNLADACACQLGRGNCGGYYTDPLGNCAISGITRPGVAGSASCDCSYHPGGCVIKTPAPNGWKCICVYKGFWTCSGWAQQCYAGEKCLGNDYSYCGCMQGSGSCGGYPDSTKCGSAFVSQSCNCNRGSDWSKGLYDIVDVRYDTASANIKHLKPSILAIKGIPNYTGTSQSISVIYGEKLTKTSSYSYTKGIQIETGTTFTVKVPELVDASYSYRVTGSKSQTWGKAEAAETMFQGRFDCNGAPHKYTQCSVTVRNAKLDIPYTMSVKHKLIPNCVCESNGVWHGTQVYNAHLTAKVLGDCLDNKCSNEFE